jgi:uncharacterized membrane protein
MVLFQARPTPESENTVAGDNLMSNVANASINTLPSAARQAGFESPSEQLIALTYGQLQGLIREAIQPLQDRIESLEATVARHEEKIAALESTQETQADNQLIQLRLIGQLREATKKEAQPLQKDRAEILRALIAANGGKMLAKDARQKMRVPKSSFCELLKSCDFVEKRPYHLDPRRDVLVLK